MLDSQEQLNEKGEGTWVCRGQSPVEMEWRAEGQRAACHAGTPPRRTTGVRTEDSERHTSITETNRLPSALVVVPSLSKLKNKGRDNREQLVTLKKLKSRVLLLATKKAKVQFKIKLKRKQVQ